MVTNLAITSVILPFAYGGTDLLARFSRETPCPQSLVERLQHIEADLLVSQFSGDLARIQNPDRNHRVCVIQSPGKAEMLIGITPIQGTLHTVAYGGRSTSIPLAANEVVVSRSCPGLPALARQIQARMQGLETFVVAASPEYPNSFVVFLSYTGGVPDDDTVLSMLGEALA